MNQKRKIQTIALDPHSFDYTHVRTRTLQRRKGNWLLAVSDTFHSGLSWPDVPGLRPTTAYALCKHHHLATRTHTHTQKHSLSLSAIQHLNPVTGLVINGVWALDMTALLSLCDKEPHTATLFLFRPLLCPFIFLDFGLLSSHLGISLWKKHLGIMFHF